MPTVISGSSLNRADMIIVGGQIKTPTGWAEAMAIRDGRILAIGGLKDVRSEVGAGANMINVHGMTVMPGLVDSHVHPLFAGLGAASCKLPRGATVKQLTQAVGACVAEAGPGDWIQGGNWVAASFAPGQQTRQLLDTIAPNNPVLLNDEALHSIWVNSIALKRAGISRDTPEIGRAHV